MSWPNFQQAGDSRAAEWLIRAGERAQRGYAWVTAGERFAMAAELLAGVPGEERTRARILCRVARVVRFADPTEGLPAVEEAIRLADLRWRRCVGGRKPSNARSPALLHGQLHPWLRRHGKRHGCVGNPAAAGEDQGSIDAEDWLADALPARALVGEERPIALAPPSPPLVFTIVEAFLASVSRTPVGTQRR